VHSPFNRIEGSRPSPNDGYLAFYVLNPTSLSKPNAVKQLTADVRQYNVDVVMISESWFNDKIDSRCVGIDGFKLFRKDRRNRNCGGVCIYIRNNITSEVILPADFPTESPVEILVLKTEFHGYTYFIICCYSCTKTGLIYQAVLSSIGVCF
jgi:hypothetical protein